MISSEVAGRMLDAIRAGAASRELNVAMCVVDAVGDLIVFERMDRVGRLSIELSQRKAYTAAMLKMPTADLKPLVEPGGALYGLTHLNGGQFISFGGGLPLTDAGQLAGAVGVSGASSQVDAELASLAVELFEFEAA